MKSEKNKSTRKDVVVPNLTMPGLLLRLPQVLSLVPICRSSLWKMCKEGRFPAPFKLAPRTTVWSAEAVSLYLSQVGGGRHDSE